uniref:septation protein SepH n=3 Tax=Varibaculum sp. TaxID=1895474 RepID=UPI0025F2EC3E
MKDLELLGLHPDGNQLILNDGDGERYAIAITQQLRDAVRVTRPNLEAVPQNPQKVVSPRKIQSLIRAGSTINEVAAKFDIPEEKVRRYATAILAERSHAASLARSCQVGGESDSPQLGELVIDRLAARGVAADSLRWDAVRDGKGPWEIILTFTQEARELSARWHMEAGSSSVNAIDQEAIWLTETSRPASKVSSFEEFFPVSSPQPAPPSEPDTGTDALLDALSAARGKRDASPNLPIEDEDDFEDVSIAEPTGADGSADPKEAAEIVSLHGMRPGSGQIDKQNPQTGTNSSRSIFSPPDSSESAPEPLKGQGSPASTPNPIDRREQVWDREKPTFVGTLSETEALNLDLTRRSPAGLSGGESGTPSR